MRRTILFSSRALRVLATAAVVAATLGTVGATSAAQTSQDLASLTLEDLMTVHVERVFGASKRVQLTTEAPSSVTIITADDIARYGYRTLSDIVDGVRGFYV